MFGGNIMVGTCTGVEESASSGRAAAFGGSMRAISFTGRWQESAKGGRAAIFSGSMMALSFTGRGQESATGGWAATFGGSMMAKARTNVKVAANWWLR
jgi:hypothetical protein